MTNTHFALNNNLVLNDVSHVLPDGRTLFSGLHEQFDSRTTGLVGRNGAGKTVLARILAGQLQPTSGTCQRSGSVYYLAQQVAPPENATVADLAGVQRTLEALSGGERLKAALACILYADSPPQLLLLDEPNNHLDLPSAQALETMLRSYRGALLVVSHDDVFVNNLKLTDHLVAGDQGWCLEPI